MTTDKIKIYEQKKSIRIEAEQWLALLKNVDHIDGSKWSISSAHCKAAFTICGQASPGSKNYHESPTELNDALMKMLFGENSAERGVALLWEAVSRLRSDEIHALEIAQAEIEQLREELLNDAAMKGAEQ
jgi:hypothetical protein